MMEGGRRKEEGRDGWRVKTEGFQRDDLGWPTYSHKQSRIDAERELMEGKNGVSSIYIKPLRCHRNLREVDVSRVAAVKADYVAFLLFLVLFFAVWHFGFHALSRVKLSFRVGSIRGKRHGDRATKKTENWIKKRVNCLAWAGWAKRNRRCLLAAAAAAAAVAASAANATIDRYTVFRVHWAQGNRKGESRVSRVFPCSLCFLFSTLWTKTVFSF